MALKITRTPENHCPKCNHKIDSASPTGKDTDVPEPGDFSICLDCTTVLVFDHDMRVKLFIGAVPSYVKTARRALIRAKAMVDAQRN